MNLEQIDEFIYVKVKSSLGRFLSYIQPGFELAKREDLNQGNKEIIELFENYGKNVILYQVNATSLILDLFHSIELYFKSFLYEQGEYLVFKSIDSYPKEKQKWMQERSDRDITIQNRYKDIMKSFQKGKMERMEAIIKEVVPFMIDEDESLVVRSVSVINALDRLVNYLNWDIGDDFRNRFETLVACRNDIVHFGIFDKITFSCSAAIHCLFSLSKGAPQEKYPKFSTLFNEFESQIEGYSEFMQYVKYFESDIVGNVVKMVKNERT